MADVTPCTRLHPGWRAGEDYRRQADLRGDWQVTGEGLYARHVVHDHQSYDGFARFAPGAVLRYVGSMYEHDNDYFEGGLHILQLLDPGPGWESPQPTGLLAPHVGDCYEAWEYIDDDTLGRWWKATLTPVGE